MIEQPLVWVAASGRLSSIATDSTHKPRRCQLRQGFEPDWMLAQRS
ncbi:hypothetical protein HGA13_00770 [Nocardia speluncae]|uniref:Uncharacterized protein n=1 Tax=Nocardia speluncae TaxID=419477 RepID=A0A846X9C0_9NOCA|nr:hypothetical protein [Nocardia speluncae]NKY31609.1 hypothetical protein [Nocardia speluncae]